MEGYIQALIDVHTKSMNSAVHYNVQLAESKFIYELESLLGFYKKTEKDYKFKEDIKEALKGVKMKDVSINSSSKDFDLAFIKAIGR